MDLYSQKSRSYPQKIVIILLATFSVVVSYGALFSNRCAGVRVAGLDISVPRSLILFSFNVIVFGRVLFTLFYFLERRIPVEEVLSMPLAFAVYLVGFPLLAASNRHGAGLLEIAGIVLFVLGSFLNSFAELQRKRWKLHPQNKGRLYTGGLFSWSMHINYFGDLVWVAGYALVTHNPWSAVIPVCLFGFFYFWNIPKLDAHLSQKYGREFTAYASRTKRLIPLIL
jgi:protein-S-isoprenylcysteine O-methyltransferase Ste14